MYSVAVRYFVVLYLVFTEKACRIRLFYWKLNTGKLQQQAGFHKGKANRFWRQGSPTGIVFLLQAAFAFVAARNRKSPQSKLRTKYGQCSARRWGLRLEWFRSSLLGFPEYFKWSALCSQWMLKWDNQERMRILKLDYSKSRTSVKSTITTFLNAKFVFISKLCFHINSKYFSIRHIIILE